MDRMELIRQIATAAGVTVEYNSAKLGEVVIVCQLVDGGTLCWSDVDEETCAVAITSRFDGKIATKSAELRYSNLDELLKNAFN